MDSKGKPIRNADGWLVIDTSDGGTDASIEIDVLTQGNVKMTVQDSANGAEDFHNATELDLFFALAAHLGYIGDIKPLNGDHAEVRKRHM